MQRNRICAAVLGCAALVVGPGCASAATYFVSPHGSDRLSGRSAERPWRSLSRVNRARLAPGDRVLFQGGGVWHGMLDPLTSGTARRPILFASYGHGRPVIDGTRTLAWAGIHVAGRSHLVFRNVQVQRFQGQRNQLVYLWNVNDISFDRLYGFDAAVGIHGSPTAPARDVSITRSVLSHFHYGHGGTALQVPLHARGWVVARTTITDAGDSCVIDRGSGSIYNRVSVHHCGFSRLAYGAHGLYLKGPNISIVNSRVADARSDCVTVRYQGDRVLHNDLHGCHFGVSWYDDTSRHGRVTIVGNRISDSRICIYLKQPRSQAWTIHANRLSCRERIVRR